MSYATEAPHTPTHLRPETARRSWAGLACTHAHTRECTRAHARTDAGTHVRTHACTCIHILIHIYLYAFVSFRITFTLQKGQSSKLEELCKIHPCYLVIDQNLGSLLTLTSPAFQLTLFPRLKPTSSLRRTASLEHLTFGAVTKPIPPFPNKGKFCAGPFFFAQDPFLAIFGLSLTSACETG